MLQQICEHIHNYFIKMQFVGEFTISDGAFSPDLSIKDGQRFLIAGSDLNDGVYTYHAAGITDDDDIARAGLADEIFTGTISGLAVPPQLLSLSAEVYEWVGKYGDVINSPYQSESVLGVYSYEKASVGGSQNGNSKPATWENIFADRLNRWRKVAFL